MNRFGLRGIARRGSGHRLVTSLSFRPTSCSGKSVFLINWQGFLRKNGYSAGPLKRKTLHQNRGW